MDILIHGTKGGRKIFTPKKLAGLIDVTADSAKSSAIGQEAYAVRFTAEYTIFSKYKIIRDVRGDKRTGFVAFSLFLLKKERLSGKDIKTLLDTVSNDFYGRNNIEDNNLNDVVEDWNFLKSISEKFRPDPVSSENIETLQSGTKDDAFIYYNDENELERFLDAPFQEQYNEYRQVLFVSKNFREKSENPLNALRHYPVANLTGEIDLAKREYRLKDFHGVGKNGITIKIWANEKLLTDNGKITSRDRISITYSKNKYYNNEGEQNKHLDDPKIRKYLIVDEQLKRIEVIKDIELQPISKTISFEIKATKGNIKDVEIKCKKINSKDERIAINNQITFSGEEQKEKWVAFGKKEDFSGKTEFVPEETKGGVSLVLEEKRIITIDVKDEDTQMKLEDFEVWTKLTKGYKKITEIEFIGDQLKDKYSIEIRKKGYEEKTRTDFRPDTESHIEIILKRKKPIQSPSSGKKDSTIAQNKKKESLFSKRLVFVGCVVILLVLGFVWFLSSQKDEQEQNLTSIQEINKNAEEINKYVEGAQLISDTLKRFKTDWQKQMPNKQTDSTSYNEWNVVQQSIDRAILKRNLIDSLDFAKLKNQRYSESQQNFKDAIAQIDSPNQKAMEGKLGMVSNLSLNQIADSIKSILADLKKSQAQKEADKREQNDANVDNTAKTQDSKKTKQPEKINDVKQSEQTPKAVMQPRSGTQKSEEIKKYLKGSQLKKDKLNEYRSDDPSFAKSIDLCLEFWDLDGSGNKKYSSLLEKVNKDQNLNKSYLSSFLKTMSGKNDPKYPSNIPENKKLTLEQLKNSIQQ